MKYKTKAQWAQSLEPGDLVLTQYQPLPLRDEINQRLTVGTVEYVFAEAFTQSGTCVKLKEFPYELDIFWIQPYIQ